MGEGHNLEEAFGGARPVEQPSPVAERAARDEDIYKRMYAPYIIRALEPTMRTYGFSVENLEKIFPEVIRQLKEKEEKR